MKFCSVQEGVTEGLPDQDFPFIVYAAQIETARTLAQYGRAPIFRNQF
jgi:hypothetical protein